MSYSRWSNSRWYAFWSAMGAESTQYKWPTRRLKNNQVFEICDMPSYFTTYGDLTIRPRAEVLKEVEEHFSKDFEWNGLEIVDGKLELGKVEVIKGKKPTKEELEELSGYFDRFIKDINDHFRFWIFIRYEWYYPFRNKIIYKIRKFKRRYE